MPFVTAMKIQGAAIYRKKRALQIKTVKLNISDAVPSVRYFTVWFMRDKIQSVHKYSRFYRASSLLGTV